MKEMDLSKIYDFFQPDDPTRIHILGCGSVGSTVVENLARCGLTHFALYDFDVVEEHNIVNQMFRQQDIGRPKVEALRDIVLEINPAAEPDIELHPKGWNGEMLSGYVFLAVDSIEIRRKFVDQHMSNPYLKAVFDIRTGFTDAQHYAADWTDYEMKKNLRDTMDFTDEEAEASTPVSACGITLGIGTVVRLISAYAVNNFLNYLKGEKIRKTVIMDGFNFTLHGFY